MCPGAVLWVCFALAAPTTTVAVDNGDPGFSIRHGAWATGDGGSPHGADYRWAASVGTIGAEPSAIVEWRPGLPVDGLYEVAAWYVAGSNRAPDATFTIAHAAGASQVVVDQQSGGEQWFILGTFRFEAGSNGFVSLHNQASAGVVVADAVRFRPVKAEPGRLTLAIRPAGAGGVTPDPGVPVKHDFMAEVAISAEAAPGFAFHHWEVSTGRQADRPKRAKTSVAVDQTKTVTAVFVRPDQDRGEFRGLWADVYHPGMKSKAEIDDMVARAVAGRYNAIVAEVMAQQDSGPPGHGAYWGSLIVPQAADIQGGLDPLAYLIKQAHAQNIEVHAWLVPFGVGQSWPPEGNSALAEHPEWLMTTRALRVQGLRQNTGQFHLDPGASGAQDYLMSIVRELCTKYAIDGIHWDTVRYTSKELGYPAAGTYSGTSLARFHSISDRADLPLTADPQWSDFRRRAITEFVRRAMIEIRLIEDPKRPLRHTAALATWAPADDDFRNTAPYFRSFSNWKHWQEMGYLDATIPMVYFDQDSYPEAYRAWVDNCVKWAREYKRHTFIGSGIYMNSFDDSVGQILYAQAAGANGICTYSLRATNDGGRPWSDWYALAANATFPEPAAPPAMPWLDPSTATEGMVCGRVTDAATGEPIDNASVSTDGGKPVLTDGNGYYALTRLVAPKEGRSHGITVGARGYVTETKRVSVSPARPSVLDLCLKVDREGTH